MSVSVFHLYTDLQADAGLPTPTRERLEWAPNRDHLNTLSAVIQRRYPGDDVRFAEFPALVTGTGGTLIGLAHDPDKDAPYINLWSPVRLDLPKVYGPLIAVVSSSGVTFVMGDDYLNAAIGIHVRHALGDAKAPPPGINGRGLYVSAKEVL